MTDKKKHFEKPYDLSLSSISRGIILVFLPISAYFLGLFPFLTIFFTILPKIAFLFNGLIYYFILSIYLIISFIILIIIISFLPIIFIRLLHIQIPPGEHQISIKDTGFFYHMLFFTLYRPSLQFISLLPLTPLRARLIKLAGLKIGKTSLLAGTEFFDEPYAVSIGEHTLIGGFSTIYAHISHKTLHLKPVRIGNNCFIGNKSVILPGVKIEDNVIVEPGSVVTEDQILKKGKRYGGNPATIIKNI